MSETSQQVGFTFDKIEESNSPALGRESYLGKIDIDGLLACFPRDEFREGQKEALTQIGNAIQSGYRYIVIEAPTGSGKSMLAMTLARYYKSAHIITGQHILQDQYQAEFSSVEGVFVIKGRGGYSCQVTGMSCAKGLCKLSSDYSCGEACPYRKALHQAVQSPITIHNFDSYYYQREIHPDRPMVIFDEAHNIEGKCLNFLSLTISNRLIPQIDIPDLDHDVVAYQQYINKDVLPKLETRISQISSMLQQSPELLTTYEKLTALQSKIGYFNKVVAADSWVSDYKKEDDGETVITFRPVYVGEFASKMFFPKNDYSTYIFLSGTFLNKQIFCENVGLDPNETKYIELPSVFPPENRPIFVRQLGSLNYRDINKTLPVVVQSIQQILSKFPTKKGIIHTHSEYIASYIQRTCHNPRLTFRRDFITVNDMLAVHQGKPGSFIVASGLREGLDLKEDLSRVQIIVKMPYLDLGDQRVQRRKALNPSWYSYMTALNFIQMIGRSVRSKTDKAITYVLDESFLKFMKYARRYIPNYVREAIRTKK